MEIVTSPLDQNIVVTASADTTIRFWSIDRKHKKQPCFLMCAGEGHRETVLSVVSTASQRRGPVVNSARHFMQQAITCFPVGWTMQSTW